MALFSIPTQFAYFTPLSQSNWLEITLISFRSTFVQQRAVVEFSMEEVCKSLLVCVEGAQIVNLEKTETASPENRRILSH